MEPEREETINECIQDIGEDTFPDNAVEWRVLSIRHFAHYSLVEAAPVPSEVGYPRFAFVLHFAAGADMQSCACYGLDGGTWKLLCSSPGTPTDWKTLGVAP